MRPGPPQLVASVAGGPPAPVGSVLAWSRFADWVNLLPPASGAFGRLARLRESRRADDAAALAGELAAALESHPPADPSALAVARALLDLARSSPAGPVAVSRA